MRRALGGDDFVVSADSAAKHMPRQKRAFDSERKVTNARKGRQSAQLIHWTARRHREHRLQPIGQRLRVPNGLPRHILGHEGGGGLTDCAAGTLKTDVHDDVLFDAYVDREAVATQGIVAVGFVNPLDDSTVPWLATVIEDHLLVQLVQCRIVADRHAKMLLTECSDVTSASTSSRVL